MGPEGSFKEFQLGDPKDAIAENTLDGVGGGLIGIKPQTGPRNPGKAARSYMCTASKAAKRMADCAGG